MSGVLFIARRGAVVLGLPVVLIAAWWVTSSGSDSFYFPPLATILQTFVTLWLSPQAVPNVAPSLLRFAVGYFAAAALGIAIGIPVGSSRNLRATIEPVLEFLRAIPPPVLIPVLILFAGIGDEMKILVIVFGCVWPVLLNTVAGVRALDEVLEDVVRCYRIGRFARLRHFVLAGREPADLHRAAPIALDRHHSDGGLRNVRGVERHRLRAGAISAHLRDPGNVERHHCSRPDRHRAVADLSCGGSVAAGLVSRLAADAAGRLIMSESAMDRAPNRVPMLEVKKLRKVYDGGGRTVEAIRDVNFKVGEGELVCIVGPSGAGKTTLLKCIAGLLAPTSGGVILEGNPVNGPPPAMAVVFQEYGRSLFPWMTVHDNVALPLKQKKMPARTARAIGARCARRHGRSAPMSTNAYPWQLSGGMQQRVAIARAVAYEPHVLLMDEPFAAVDAQTRADLEDLIRVLWRKLKVTVLFVTHDIDESVYLGQRVLIMSHAPTVIMEDVTIDLPGERTQLETRSLPRFGELRKHIYSQIQLAKQGWRPPGG